MSATYNKFNAFVADMANKVHNLGADTLTFALTDSAPSASNSVISSITQISYANLSSRNLTVTSSSQSGGTYKLAASALTLTASGTVPQFRYAVLYNSTTGSGNLIAWFDYGSEVNLNSGDTLTLTPDGTNGVIQIE